MPILYQSGGLGGVRVGTTNSYAKDNSNFKGNQDMHDLENGRIAQQNYDAAHELDYLNLLESRIRKIVNESIRIELKKNKG